MTPLVSTRFQIRNKIGIFLGVSFKIISAVFMARFVIDIGTRMIYPFIPQIAAGLGLSVVGFSQIIFIRLMMGTTAPIFGILSDRFGRRLMMSLGLLMQAVGSIGMVLTEQWWVTIPMMLFGFSLVTFVPAQQAYISEVAPYHKRGRAMVTVEYTWALANILVLPIVGWLIARGGWHTPFIILSLFSVAGAALTWFFLPIKENHTSSSLNWSSLQAICLKRNVLASVGVALFLFMAIGMFATIWGIWLEADFELPATSVGLIATGIGITELVGSGISSLFIDRVGKRYGSSLGFLCIMGSSLSLFYIHNYFWLAIIGLLLVSLCIEFTVVSLIPLYSEQTSEARGTMMSLIQVGTAIGGAIGAPLATTLWIRFGIRTVFIMVAIFSLIAFGLLWKFLQDSTSIHESRRKSLAN